MGVVDFVDYLANTTLVAVVGLKTVSLECCTGSTLRFAQWGVCDFVTKSREEGEKCNEMYMSILQPPSGSRLGPINTRTGNYSAKYLFYRYDDVVAMILPVTGFRLECAKSIE